ncbi:MAG: CvpA family protein [Proteobacteria bacterium]|nr:CvpA family protein [Pseudomonadota bacterium]HQR04960.1 CvpA family protein [Rhodocyclaceae bacterium]
MTLFDYTVLGVIAASVLLGLWRGVASELLALIAWVAAFFVARTWATAVAEMLAGSLSDPMLRYSAAFAILFLGVLMVAGVLRFLVSRILRSIGLGPLDRVLGAVFGIGRGLVLAFLVVFAAGFTTLPRQSWWQQAELAPPFETAVIASKSWMPPEVAKRIHYR